MQRSKARLFGGLWTAVFILTLLPPATALAKGVGEIRQVTKTGTTSPRTLDAPSSTNATGDIEFPSEVNDEDTDPSLSSGQGSPLAIGSMRQATGNRTFVNGFEGLNHYQQRYSRRGNQFSLEPPDQALCVGSGYVLEATNDVLNVFNSAGVSQLPDNTATNVVGGFARNVNHAVDLNSFYGYAPAINRSIAPGNPGRFGPFITDPTCLYDAATGHFFLVVLTLDVNSTTGGFLLTNHLDLAVSQTANPTGSWNLYSFDVTGDGSPGTTGGPCPCLGDYPHIGADANGFYITTNAYPWGPGAFDGAQIYAFSKADLAAGALSPTMVHIDTTGMVAATSPVAQTEPGFTVWPAQSPGSSSFSTSTGGTEYFLSSNAAEEAAGAAYTGSSTNLIVWALTNTSSLNTVPVLGLSNTVLTVDGYSVPPKQRQPGSGTPPGVADPLGHCINDTTQPTPFGAGCWNFLFVGEPAHNEVVSRPDSNDTRMQQVMYADGKVWGALDTAVSINSGPARAGIAWYIVNPSGPSVAKSGFLGHANYDFTYPAVGVAASGRGLIGFTATGGTLNPSAAYAPIDASAGVGPWNIVPGGQGAAPDDGFTSYKSFVGNPPRTRWGDYGAAAVDGNYIWLANEYIAQKCNYPAWGGPFFGQASGDNLLGTCGGSNHGPGARSALANWSTYVSRFKP